MTMDEMRIKYLTDAEFILCSEDEATHWTDYHIVIDRLLKDLAERDELLEAVTRMDVKDRRP